MSAFLGPIHVWLFKKIQIQEEMVERIIEVSERNQWAEGLLEKVNQRYGILEKEPLEEIIDTQNIHGWLQTKVSLVENRLAFVVTILLNEDSSRIELLCEEMKLLGEKYQEEFDTVAQIYKKLNDTLLDGMPCDNVNEVVSEEEGKIIWKRKKCIHHEYWDLLGGENSYYYKLRDSFIAGMLEKSNFVITKVEETTYRLLKKEKSL